MSPFNRQRHSKCFLNFLGKCFPEASGSVMLWFMPWCSREGSVTAKEQHCPACHERHICSPHLEVQGWHWLFTIAENQEELQKNKNTYLHI